MHAALPMPDDPEASIARALFIRDLEQPLRQFWTREAAALREAPGEEELRAVDARWRALTRSGVLAILHSAPDVTQKVLEVVNRFPVEERDYAWSRERARLTDSRQLERVEAAFAQEMLGAAYADDVRWIARLNELRHAGDLLERRWRAWNRTDERVRELTLPRDAALEQAVLEQPESVERRLFFAEWLCEQEGGESLGEYIQLSAASPRSWRAELLVEHDCSVAGPLIGTRIALDWRAGLICSATCWTSELELLSTHAAAFTLEHVELMLDERFTLPARAPCLKRVTLEHAEARADLVLAARDALVALAKIAPLEEVRVSARFSELPALLRQVPWKVNVVLPDE